LRIAVDCEFNGFGGQLISMALVAENGDEWYQMLPEPQVWDEWCFDNVLPVLSAHPIPRKDFRESLHAWLKQYEEPTIIADWPSDLVHFFNELLGEDHSQSLMYPCGAVLLDIDIKSDMPHNALSDARAIMREFKRSHSGRQASK
jgi:hypothetical protein